MKDNNFRNRIKYSTSEQNEAQEKLYSLIDEYEKNNSLYNREFLCYLTSAIFLTYKKLFPQLNIYIPFRTKSDMSYIQNIQKEFSNSASINDEWDTFSTIKDLSAIKIIIDDINFSKPANENSIDLFEDENIKKLYNKSKDNFNFIEKVEYFLKSSIKSVKEYLELRQELLEKITDPDITPSEFTNERHPHRSFKELLVSTNKKRDYYKENPEEIPTNATTTDISNLRTLLNDLRSRTYDQLQFAILKKTLPIILKDPLITNVLQTSSEFDKHIRKPNGFEGIYYNLFTPFGPVELISESNFAYYKDKKGSAYHSGIGNKAFNVTEFFELVDKNDEHPLSYYLDILDSVSADSLVSAYELPNNENDRAEFLKTPKGQAYLESEKYYELMKHIKIKEKIELSPNQLEYSEELKKYVKSENTNPRLVSTDDYLISTALSYSPYMNVCSASHTSYTSASIHHKKVIGEFVEVLRKKDCNTCLREILLRRFEKLIDDNLSIYNSNDKKQKNKLSGTMENALNVIKSHDEAANKLPKDISEKNIILYAEKLRDIQIDDLDLVI